MKISNIILYLFPSLSLGLFGCVYLNTIYIKITFFFVLFIILLYTIPLIFKKYKKNSYSFWIRNIVLSILVSFIPCFIFHDQSLYLSYTISSFCLSVTYFFFLMKEKISMKEVERVIILYGCFFVICWIVDLLTFPNVVFTSSINHISDNMDRGALRFNIPGIGFLCLFYLYCLCKYINTKNKYMLSLAIFLYIVVVFQVTRQIILAITILSIWCLIKKMKYKYLCLGILTIILCYIPYEKLLNNDTMIAKMINQTIEQQNNNTQNDQSDVRIRAYRYFLCDFNKNITTVIIGNGQPHSLSSYGIEYEKKRNVNRFFLTDVGYAAIFVLYGIIGLVFFIGLFLYNIKNKVSSNVYYSKLYLVYLIIITFVSFGILYDMIILSLAAYSLQSFNQKELK